MWKFHSCSFVEVRPVLGQVVDTPAGVQRHARGPDCAENRGVSAVAALGTGLSRVIQAVFEPSMMKSLGVALTPGVLLPGVRPPVDGQTHT